MILININAQSMTMTTTHTVVILMDIMLDTYVLSFSGNCIMHMHIIYYGRSKMYIASIIFELVLDDKTDKLSDLY
jgi:hypothetical protein